MNRIAVAVWQGSIATTLDFARTIMIVDADRKGILTRQEIELTRPPHQAFDSMFRERGIAVAICGAISRDLERCLERNGVQVIPYVSGNAEEVLRAFLDGTLRAQKFTMAGCRPGGTMHEPEHLRALNMITSLAVTVLVDDTKAADGLKTEHGFAVWLDADNFRLLFDTGAGGVLQDNARTLGIELSEIDAVAISHGHTDHTGGLSHVLSECRKATFFLHPGALRTRYVRSDDGAVRAAGFPLGAGELFADRKDRVRWTESMTHLRPGVFVTGEVPRTAAPEASTKRFFLDAEGRRPDPLSDDQALVVDTADGVVVVLGCGHAGIANTLSAALGHSRSGRLRALIGGMHLGEAPVADVNRLADRLAELGPQIICPCHCAGPRAREVLKRRFPDAYREGGAGIVLRFTEGSRMQSSREERSK